MLKPAQRIVASLIALMCLSNMIVSQAQDAPDNQAIKQAVMASAEPVIIQSFGSPDGTVYAQVTIYECVDIGESENAYERLDIINATSGQVQLVTEQVISCQGLGGYGLSVLRWSDNSAFLYYTDAREGQPDGLSYGWVRPVYRLQMVDFTVTPLGQAQFSPDGQRLVAWTQSQITLIMSINDATVITFDMIPLDLVIINVMWLPDVSGIIYVQSDNFMLGTRSTVTYIDLTTMQQSVLLDSGA